MDKNVKRPTFLSVDKEVGNEHSYILLVGM